MKDTYVAAVHQALNDGTDPELVITGLKRVLTERGHERLLAPVLRTVLTLNTTSRTRTTLIRVASNADLAANKAAIEAALADCQATDEPEVIVDDTVVGGWQVEANGTRVDASYKTALTTLYRAITTD
jgi:F0F1-type ATP synthase delta subunit